MIDSINEFLLQQTNLKKTSKLTYRSKLLCLARFLGNDKKITEKEVLLFFDSGVFKSLKITTQNLYKKVIRKYLKYLNLNYENIKTIKDEPEPFKLEDLPTKEEINELLNDMPRAMDRCLLMVFLEGLRLSEAKNVKIEDVVNKETHIIIHIKVSKSKKRPVPVINSIPYIIEWLNQHPDKNNLGAYLFSHKREGKIIPYSSRGLQQILDRNNNLTKRIHPHLFRHTSATLDYGKLNEKEMMLKYGWRSRDMIDRYAHLKDTSLEDKILQLHGIIPAKLQEESIKIVENKICPRCKFENPSVNIFCSRCGCALDIKTILEHQKIAKELDELGEQLNLEQYINELIEKRLGKVIKKNTKKS